MTLPLRSAFSHHIPGPYVALVIPIVGGGALPWLLVYATLLIARGFGAQAIGTLPAPK